jgi:transcriptional regulator with XRE-family HTH domain
MSPSEALQLATQDEGRKQLRKGTLAWLAQEWFAGGHTQIRDMIERATPGRLGGRWLVVRAGDGEPAARAGVSPEGTDGAPAAPAVSYRAYGPPPLWGSRYAILRATVRTERPSRFLSHTGEELVIPCGDGAVQQESIWTPGGESPRRWRLASPLGRGQLLRNNPFIPHRVWSCGEDTTDVWMVLRDSSESVRSISTDGRTGAGGELLDSRLHFLDEDAAREPINYALLAWGISPLTRLLRQRADIALKELADRCAMDAGQLSRLESADPRANLQLDAFTRIATELGIPIASLVEHSTWLVARGDLTAPPDAVAADAATADAVTADAVTARSVLPPPAGRPHMLHPYRIAAPAGWSGPVDPPTLAARTAPLQSSWIVLAGTARLHLPGEAREIVDEGDIIHFRQTAPTHLDAISDFSAVQIVYATDCACDAPAAPPTSWVSPVESSA